MNAPPPALLRCVDGASALALAGRRRAAPLDPERSRAVQEILERVQRGGDAALLAEIARIEGTRAKHLSELKLSRETLARAAERIDVQLLDALEGVIERVRRFQTAVLPQSTELRGAAGERLLQRIVPLRRVGVYVPGGKALYPSSVIMNVVPAQCAGVGSIAVVTPPRAGHDGQPKVADVLLAALYLCGVEEVWTFGGAQAIAALAFGTESLEAVDKIAGPGNAWVATAKALVADRVGIDMIAGPSEVMILADDDADPDAVAADLLAQAEHDEEASAVLVSTEPALAGRLSVRLAARLEELPEPNRSIARASLRDHGLHVAARSVDEAIAVAEAWAPEHLELCLRDAAAVAERITRAGAVFVGDATPEVVGDYVAGPSHTLPTAGCARFASGLSSADFVRRMSVIEYGSAALRRDRAWIEGLARAEGLHAHARSARAGRRERGGEGA
ncbi:MAG: histidinol dehydrogenase [Planctomycetes bacterium]|nr:histidinol dehydrogenase [Planctomycetota bacterium]